MNLQRYSIKDIKDRLPADIYANIKDIVRCDVEKILHHLELDIRKTIDLLQYKEVGFQYLSDEHLNGRADMRFPPVNDVYKCIQSTLSFICEAFMILKRSNLKFGTRSKDIIDHFFNELCEYLETPLALRISGNCECYNICVERVYNASGKIEHSNDTGFTCDSCQRILYMHQNDILYDDTPIFRNLISRENILLAQSIESRCERIKAAMVNSSLDDFLI